MGSSSEKTLAFSGTAASAFAAAEQALLAIGAKVSSSDAASGTLTATKGESFVSRGETLTLRIERLDDGCSILVRSESADDIDWGRNAANLAQFERALTGGSSVPTIGTQIPASPPLPRTGGGSYPTPAVASPTREAAAPAPVSPSIFGPSTFPSIFAEPASQAPVFAATTAPNAAREPITESVDVTPSPTPDTPAPEPAPTALDALQATAVTGEPALGTLLSLDEAGRSEARSLLTKLEARRAALEASASTATTTERVPLREENQPWQQEPRTGTPAREPEAEPTLGEGRFFCSVDGEFGPVEPCARCGLYLCARHRRRSSVSALFTNAHYVCESCFQMEVAEQRGSNLNIRSGTVDAPFPIVRRTPEGWRMESDGKPANVWAALGTAVSLLLAVLFLTAIGRSLGSFFFLLTVAVIGGYIWGRNVHWWMDEYLAAAPPGRRRAVWLLAAPGLFFSVAALRLTQLALGAAGARRRAARLDPTREQILTAAEDAWDQALS